jgi:hypothetical protein
MHKRIEQLLKEYNGSLTSTVTIAALVRVKTLHVLRQIGSVRAMIGVNFTEVDLNIFLDRKNEIHVVFLIAIYSDK